MSDANKDNKLDAIEIAGAMTVATDSLFQLHS